MLFSAITMTLASAALVFGAPMNVTERQNSVQVIGNCFNQGQVAMTFDDSFTHNDPAFADAVRRWGGKATFFINGINAEKVCIYDRAKEIRAAYAAGHVIASHTWSHRRLSTLNEAQQEEDIVKIETAMVKILGVKPKYFRPGHGDYNDITLKILSRRGYTKLFGWTHDTNWETDLAYQKGVINNLASKYPQPGLLLQHPQYQYTLEATKYAAETLARRGYKLVTVEECSGGGSPYERVGLPQLRDGSWVC